MPLDISTYIDHTLLRPDAVPQDIERLCAEARQYRFYAVCVSPFYVPLCKKLLAGTPVKIATVVGFPLGATLSEAKAFEAAAAAAAGADEMDMVMNIGAMKAGDHAVVEHDIAAVRKAVEGRVLKVIIETALLTDDEKARACRIATAAGADFVKTSTGFSRAGATEHDVRLMRQAVGDRLGVKASGGIKSREQALRMIDAGARRIGTSSSVAIVTGN